MQKFNGESLFKLMEHCRLNNIDFEVRENTIQGLHGIYLMCSDFVKVDSSYSNCFLISELNE